jgi:hypothetical protein
MNVWILGWRTTIRRMLTWFEIACERQARFPNLVNATTLRLPRYCNSSSALNIASSTLCLGNACI